LAQYLQSATAACGKSGRRRRDRRLALVWASEYDKDWKQARNEKH